GLAALLPFTDLGLGHGVMTALAAANSSGDDEARRRLIARATSLMSLAALALLVLAFVVEATVGWATLFGLGSETFAGEVGTATVVYLVGFSLTIPAAVGSRILMSMQRTH